MYVYFCRMEMLRKTINGINIIIEPTEPFYGVPHVLVCLESDPIKFPMIYKKEFGWFFVDKMTLLELKSMEKEISDELGEGII